MRHLEGGLFRGFSRKHVACFQHEACARVNGELSQPFQGLWSPTKVLFASASRFLQQDCKTITTASETIKSIAC